MPLALLALAIGAFGIGTTEFVAIGLLPDVAATFGVSIPTAGWMVSGYALGVLVGAPLMMALGTRIPRKQMLMLLMGIFVIGNIVSALAPAFGVLVVGRLIASFTHGAFFGIGAVVAAEMVAKEKRAAAIAFMFTGLTVANVVGVPLGTFVGVHAGWRATFGIVAGLGLVGLLGVATLVPRLPRPEGVRLRQEIRALGNVQVILAMLMTVLGFGGVFAAITYLAPMMTTVAGFAPSSVSWLLIALGAGMVIGNLIGGRFADRALMPMLYVTLGALTLTLAVFTVTAHSQVLAAATVLVIGALGFATVPPLQKRVLDQAKLAPTLASAINIGAFNLGNALAAWLAGRTIAAGWGYTSANVVGAAMAAAGLGVAVLAGVLESRRPAVVDVAPAQIQSPVG
ncbi:MFS transporter [Microlunatus soli]|uniref:MFS transporter, DHA1 family, arabinose polymer transporter n=1 Tax=Microlunatus soli TaxID=630515 RepID=A0A1H1VE32_9ACTN|nr:MFS transporter [Microlunatus soli]SDS82469.1 MFS transporter, DHA1 family, arabinose polymer transporter [Microlunatus soli]